LNLSNRALADGSTAAPGMDVAGNRLYRDGQEFTPRGFNFIGILGPDGCANLPRQAAAARASFGLVELLAARDDWHANTVRFQVSQSGLDPQSAIYVPAYLDRVTGAVAQARSLGLTVILSMQDQSNGCGSAHPMPSDATVRAWQNLVPLVAADPDVMFELFNEPQNDVDAAGWAQWLTGGPGPKTNQGAPIIGHQTLVQTVRDLGATNVLIADGAKSAGSLQGLPPLSDPLAAPRIAYAWHPYSFHVSGTATLATDQANWDSRTAAVSAVAPLLATEWNASLSKCTAGVAARAPDLLAYLQSQHIGLLGHAFDVVATMVQDVTTWTPTTLDGFGCNVVGPDAGLLVQDDFKAQAAAESGEDITAPTITLSTPTDGTVVGGTVDVAGAASDDVGVTSVDLVVDGVAVAAADPSSPSVPWDSASVGDGTHTLQFQAADAAGNVGRSSRITVVARNFDFTAPSTPIGLNGALSGATGVQLSWQASTDNNAVAGYHVYRDATLVATVTDGTAYLDTGLGYGTTYSYQVDAFDASANSSASGDAVAVRTPSRDTTAPSVPLGLKATVRSSSVTLAWTASHDDVGVAHYSVYRGTTLIGAPMQATFVDTGLAQGKTYSYSVTATDAAGNSSAKSSTLSVKVPDTTSPTTPTSFTGKAGSKSVTLTWKAATDNVAVTGYYVLRDGVRIATVTGVTYSNTGLKSGVKHAYAVRSCDAAGNLSPLSATIYVTPK
jgi:fibronectin type 3 domain-containing protein